MRSFDYARPHTLEEALDLLAAHGEGAAPLAGGTDLMVQMSKGVRAPDVVVDLKRVAGLSARIEDRSSHLRVGALACLADLVADRAACARLPALVGAARAIGSVQIRNRATLAGNICNASPAADTAPPLLVYGARVNVVGPGGRRTLPIGEFFIGPGRTALARGEIVETIDVPYPGAGTGSAFERLARRRGMDLALVSVACLAGPAERVRFAFGAVAPTPILVDGECAPDAPDAILEQLAARTTPITDIRAGEDYHRAMVLVLMRRALRAARRRLTESG